MAGVLARIPRVRLLLEFWPAGLARAGDSGGRVLARLGALGFRVYEVDEEERTVRRADPGRLLDKYPASGAGFTNLLCVKVPVLGLQSPVRG